MEDLKTIQFILYNDRIEMKRKETGTTFSTWYLENFKEHAVKNISTLFYEINISQFNGHEIEFKDLSTK